MLNALRANVWHNYSFFMRDDGLLSSYFETHESLDAAQAEMEVTEVNARWQDMMSLNIVFSRLASLSDNSNT
jgi:L-rhamnose mutarotase